MSRSDIFLHTVARSPHPQYPARTPVPDDLVPFDSPWPDYAPVVFTHPAVVANDCTVKAGGWADPEDV